jgi:putative Mn2+ efflux pump MntP
MTDTMIFAMALALGCDALAVGLAIGTKNPSWRQSFRLWFHFGLFQFLMTFGGWRVGALIISYVRDYDHWIAFALMFFIATRMFWESISGGSEKDEGASSDPTRGWSLVGLSVATSMDAFGVGFSMSLTAANLLVPAIVIGLVAAVMTWSGIKLGKHLSVRFGKRVETLGSLILYAIAVKLLSI